MRLLILLSMISAFSYATTELPTIRFVKGKVTVYSEGSAKKASKGLELKEGDVIETGKKSFALLKFPEITAIKIDANSKVSVKKYIDEFKYHINRGSSFFQVRKKQQRPFEVLTRTLSLGVRGTTFFVAHNKATKTSWTCVNEGSIDVKEIQTSKKIVLKEGFGISADKDQGISKPAALEWTKSLNWSFEENESSYNEAKIEENYKDNIFIDYE